MEVAITRSDLEAQIENLQKQQAEVDQERKNADIKAYKILGALEAMGFLLSIYQQRERAIAELEAFKQMEEEKKKQADAEFYAASDAIRALNEQDKSRMENIVLGNATISCPNCGLPQTLREGKCDNSLCFYHFKPNG